MSITVWPGINYLQATGILLSAVVNNKPLYLCLDLNPGLQCDRQTPSPQDYFCAYITRNVNVCLTEVCLRASTSNSSLIFQNSLKTISVHFHIWLSEGADG